MIEEARASLEQFLKNNVNLIMKHYTNLVKLRAVWLDMHPEFKDYDLELDVVWEGLSGASTMIWPYHHPETGHPMIADKGPHASGFKVVIRDWQDELGLQHRADACNEKFKRMQLELHR